MFTHFEFSVGLWFSNERAHHLVHVAWSGVTAYVPQWPTAISVGVLYSWHVQSSLAGLWGRGQTKVCTLVLQAEGYAVGWQPIHVESQVFQKCQQEILRTAWPCEKMDLQLEIGLSLGVKARFIWNPQADGHHLNQDHHYFQNVWTMFEAGKTAQVSAEMRNYNLTILWISETRWTGSSSGGLPQGNCCCIQVMKMTMHHTPREWPWCCLRQHRGHSLDWLHTDQEFLRPPSRL